MTRNEKDIRISNLEQSVVDAGPHPWSPQDGAYKPLSSVALELILKELSELGGSVDYTAREWAKVVKQARRISK